MDLQNRKVIAPVNEPTEWVTNLVATKKNNGALRVCLAPCNLNEAPALLHSYSGRRAEQISWEIHLLHLRSEGWILAD